MEVNAGGDASDSDVQILQGISGADDHDSNNGIVLFGWNQ